MLAEESSGGQKLVKTDANGIAVWTNNLASRDDWRWIGAREAPDSGFVLVGESGENICMKFLNLAGEVVSTRSWTGTSVQQRNDVGTFATRTPEGGFLIVGNAWLEGSSGYTPYDVALIKTDGEGNGQWVEFHPETANVSEAGLAAVALTNGSYVVLARRESGESRVWLFKLAYNHPPVPQMLVSTNVLPVGAAFTFDASASSDRDSTVAPRMGFRRRPDGTGALITHAYTNSGCYIVRFTAVDDEDAERSLTVTNFVSGFGKTAVAMKSSTTPSRTAGLRSDQLPAADGNVAG